MNVAVFLNARKYGIKILLMIFFNDKGISYFCRLKTS